MSSSTGSGGNSTYLSKLPSKNLAPLWTIMGAIVPPRPYASRGCRMLETAPAHRHTAFALRFIIEGERHFTAVSGKKITMKRGHVILTPSWKWHDHGHEALSLTIGGHAERVDAGSRSPPLRESCSFVYHCVEGCGITSLKLANGDTREVQWSTGDTFSVPAWSQSELIANGESRAYLFANNDLPLLQNLDMHKKEG
ncbi:RmlC-like cupin domain-containing protein [Xylariaceae sp. FL0016]|nr:RmlC-like cupin domain-containing protein [Xylariaceae sp. FL0016]